jgi:DNA-binding NarL/FixJ family response regulator
MARIVAVVSDLIFRSKVEATARAVGVEAVTCTRAADAMKALAEQPASLLLVDMTLSGNEAAATIAAGATAEPRPRIVAFCSHVEESQAEAAREAGADRVLARSAFASRLPELLRGDI